MAIYENEFFDEGRQPPDEVTRDLKKISPAIVAQHRLFLEVFPWTKTEVRVENFGAYFAFRLLAEWDEDEEEYVYHSLKLPEDQEKVDKYMSNYRNHIDSWKELLNLLKLNSQQSEGTFGDIWPEIAAELIYVDITDSISRKKTYAELHVVGADPYRFVHDISPSLLLNDFELLVRSVDGSDYENAVFIKEVQETDNEATRLLQEILERRPLRPTGPSH